MQSCLFLLGLLAGCDSFSVGPEANDTGAADTGADTDTEIDTALCGETFSTAAPGGPACFTETLSCGDVVEATNDGGDSNYVGEDWESWFCTPNLDRWEYVSPERAYSMFIPARTTATFTFESPCADLDLFVLYWQDENTCPRSGTSITECETVDDEGARGETSVWSDDGARYVVVVDGRGGETGNFRISVDCVE